MSYKDKQLSNSIALGAIHGSINIGDLSLEGGQILNDVEVAYERIGNENNPSILVCHALTGNQFSVGTTESPGWWSELIGPGLFVDTTKFQVITMNVVGGCAGTTGPTSINPETNQPYRGDFPSVTVRDMVQAQYKALTEMNIGHVQAIIGGSLGGMQVFEWGIMYPSFANILIPIASTPYLSDYSMAFNTIAKNAIKNDPAWKQGNYEIGDHLKGLELARMIGMVTYRSDELFNNRFNRELKSPEEYQVESYLNYQGEKLAKRFDPASYLRLLEAMDNHDIGRGRSDWRHALERIEAQVLLLGFTGDLLYPTQMMHEVAKVLGQYKKKVAIYEIETKYGHDGFLVEFEKWAHLIKNAVETGNVKDVEQCQQLMSHY